MACPLSSSVANVNVNFVLYKDKTIYDNKVFLVTWECLPETEVICRSTLFVDFFPQKLWHATFYRNVAFRVTLTHSKR